MKINHKKTANRIKVFISLLLSMFIVMYISPLVFIENTTAFNPIFIGKLKRIPYTIYAYARHMRNVEERNNIIQTAEIQTVEEDKDLQYRPISTGVYAAQDPITGETIVKIEAGTELEVKTIKTDDGREIKVYVPVK